MWIGKISRDMDQKQVNGQNTHLVGMDNLGLRACIHAVQLNDMTPSYMITSSNQWMQGSYLLRGEVATLIGDM